MLYMATEKALLKKERNSYNFLIIIFYRNKIKNILTNTDKKM
ncbi:hypothetical protein CLS_19520 [[Clostridium] cf. saccharolyticum K10]|nr:hypothetical protein CLS_19520 [[Clostridium] cf. saccharolyticum K10]